ncbi:OsmC-like protein [Mycobacterium tuberculosis]|nr:OsmC-like protein [Mycobacterium tuberculosis]
MAELDDLETLQISEVTVRPAPGRSKIVTVPVDGDVVMGMRAEIAEHYKVPGHELEPHATTLDYLIGATAGCLTGTFSGMLLALGQDTGGGSLTAKATGRVVKEKAGLRVASIHVVYELRRDAGVAESDITRAHAVHQRRCPIARSIGTSIALTTELRFL